MTSTIHRTAIIPDHVTIRTTSAAPTLDWRAICVFAATGFFLEADTYYCNAFALQPAMEYELDERGQVQRAQRYWSWHYAPRDISLGQATDEFAHLFERIAHEQTAGRRVILPLSGGLDSRTQAAAVHGVPGVSAYSYQFVDSFDETKYGARIAEQERMTFERLEIPRGYLWNVIDEIAAINGCYSDFTHPRQMAVIDRVAALGELFFLGHWGDVLFDDMGVRGDASFDEQVSATVGKIVKKGGLELASALWRAWGLHGSFASYLRERVAKLLAEIQIDDANARIRAFKSMYWAPRWTSVNLSVFASRRPIALPYYHADMCKLVCTLPERLLAGRQIQIEYLKRRAPALARISWQSYDPLDLYSYHRYYSYRMVPYRAMQKAKRMVREKLFGRTRITRNWQLQFLGSDNDMHLRARLFDARSTEFVSRDLMQAFYAKFTADPVRYAHAMSMLLTLSLFARTQCLVPCHRGSDRFTPRA